MEDNYIEKTVAKLEHYRQVYSRKIQVLDNTIAVIRALPAEEATMSLLRELPGVEGESKARAIAGEAKARIIDPPVIVKPGRSPSDYPGVVAVRSRRCGIRYKARPRINKKTLYLGTFETAEAAAAAIEKYKGGKETGVSIPAKKKTKTKSPGKKLRPRTADASGSKYRGVRKSVSKGKVRFEAQAWDAKKKKVCYLGMFDTELEAAVAVANRKGDSDEVRRLSDMLEQIENNPDRTAAKQITR